VISSRLAPVMSGEKRPQMGTNILYLIDTCGKAKWLIRGMTAYCGVQCLKMSEPLMGGYTSGNGLILRVRWCYIKQGWSKGHTLFPSLYSISFIFETHHFLPKTVANQPLVTMLSNG
jgi:hypothetical protein